MCAWVHDPQSPGTTFESVDSGGLAIGWFVVNHTVVRGAQLETARFLPWRHRWQYV
jgi:hypothetical protein